MCKSAFKRSNSSFKFLSNLTFAPVSKYIFHSPSTFTSTVRGRSQAHLKRSSNIISELDMCLVKFDLCLKRIHKSELEVNLKDKSDYVNSLLNLASINV